MRRPSVRPVVAGALLALGTSLLGACAASGPAPLEQGTLEKELGKQLGEVGYDVDDVSCPGDLDSEKGATTTCEFTAAGQEADVSVEVTSVKDGTVYFDAVPEPSGDGHSPGDGHDHGDESPTESGSPSS